METRIALIGIIVENPDSVEQLNHLLHEYGSFIVGRMGCLLYTSCKPLSSSALNTSSTLLPSEISNWSSPLSSISSTWLPIPVLTPAEILVACQDRARHRDDPLCAGRHRAVPPVYHDAAEGSGRRVQPRGQLCLHGAGLPLSLIHICTWLTESPAFSATASMAATSRWM